MVMYIRPHNAPPVPDARFTTSGAWTRRIYASLVFGVLAFVIYQVSKPLLFVEGPGVLTAPNTQISLPHPAYIKFMMVQPSQHVLPGTVLAIVDRPQQEDAIRDIQAKLHTLRSTQQTLSARLQNAKNNLTLARQLANESDVRWQKVQDKYKDYVTADLSSTLQRDRVEAHAKLTNWENDLVNLPKQMDLIQTEIRRLETDVHEIERTWRHKLITSEKESVVGPRVASAGASLSAGAPLLTLYDLKQSYVLWRLPALRLSDPLPGQMVSITHGVYVAKGRVRRVLNLANDAQDNSTADSNLVEVDWLDTHHRLPVGAQVVVRLTNW